MDFGEVIFDGATDNLAGGDPVEITGAGPVSFLAESPTGSGSHLVLEISYKGAPYAWVPILDASEADGGVYYGALPFWVRGRVSGTVGVETWVGRAIVSQTADEVDAANGGDACSRQFFEGGAAFELP